MDKTSTQQIENLNRLRLVKRPRTIVMAVLCVAIVGLGACSSSKAADSVSGPTEKAISNFAFTDVTEELGLSVDWSSRDWTYEPITIAEREIHIAMLPSTMAGGASIVDLNEDGWEDIFLPRVGLPNMVLINQEGVGFQDSATSMGLADEATSSSGVFADIDNDGDLDAYVANIANGADRLYLNDGAGQFTDLAERQLVTDVDSLAASMGASFGDIDSDGDLDLFVDRWFNARQGPGLSQLLINDGSGNFAPTSANSFNFEEMAAFTTTFEDINNDGRQDLMTTADWGTSRIYLQQDDDQWLNATREFNVGTDENGMGSVVADLDGDGILDWFVTSISGEQDCGDEEFGCTGNRLYSGVRADGEPGFDDITDLAGVGDGGWGWGAIAEDLDNDGDVDLAMTNGFPPEAAEGEDSEELFKPFGSDPVRVWLNDDGFKESAADIGLSDQGQGKAMLAFDYDHDGDLDVLVVNTESGPRLFRNDLESTHDWIRVSPVLANGAPAVGATVMLVQSDGKLERRDVRVGDTYGGQRSSITHFGLGSGLVELDTSGKVEIFVRWPDGSETTSKLSPNQTHEIRFQ